MEQWCRNWIKSNSILSNVIKIVVFWLFTCCISIYEHVYMNKRWENWNRRGELSKKLIIKKIFTILFFSKLFYHCAYNLIIINDLWREEFNKCYFFNSSSFVIAVQFGFIINDLLIHTNTWWEMLYESIFFSLLLFIDMLYLYCYNGVAWTNKKKIRICQSWSSQDSFPSYSLFVCVITK